MNTLYVIPNWNDDFENNRTRELKNLAWVPMPNRHDGDGYTTLLEHPRAAAHYGAWCSIVQVASKCDPRGTLVRSCRSGGENASQKPHDSGTLSRITRIPKEVYDEAIPRFLEIGWLKAVSCDSETTCKIPQDGAGLSQEGALNGKKGNERKEGKGKEGLGDHAGELPETLRTDQFVASWKRWLSHRKEISKPYKPTGLATLLKQLSDWGPQRAAAAIEFSLSKSYQGIFEEKQNGKPRTPRVGPGQQFDPNDDGERTL